MNNFWKKQKKGFLALAPMAGITDSPFRQISKEFGADILYSEMASVAALFYDQKSNKKISSPTLDLLQFNKEEKPFVVQIFGAEAEHFRKAVKIIDNFINPDGIDINFGCPVKKIRKQGAGSALMENFKKAKEIIKIVIEETDLPVSIKTRTEVYDKNILDFLDYVSDLDIKALMLHGRSLKQGFNGGLDISILKKIKNYFGGIYLVNGFNLENNNQNAKQIREYYRELLEETDADGIGVGRIVLGRPWVFKEIKNSLLNEKTVKLKINLKNIIKRHLKKSREFYGEKGIFEVRKHIIYYLKGVKNGHIIKQEIFKAQSFKEIEKIIEKSDISI